MAVRYSGPVRISVVYQDQGDYRCVVSLGGGEHKVVFVGPPAAGFGIGIAYDSPEAYDSTAHAALSFASEDMKELGEKAWMDQKGEGWHISRRKE